MCNPENHHSQAIYEADGWRWSPKSKRQDLQDPATRVLLAWPSGDNSAPTPQAYLAFRFEEEAGCAVLYVYELQLSASVQRRGLGRFLMQLAELLAHRYCSWLNYPARVTAHCSYLCHTQSGVNDRHRMGKVMLTVQRSNAAAHALYKALRYSEDETSPELDPDEPTRMAGYTILSKQLPTLVKA